MAKCDLCGASCDASSMTQLRDSYKIDGVIDLCTSCSTWADKEKNRLISKIAPQLRESIAERAGRKPKNSVWARIKTALAQAPQHERPQDQAQPARQHLRPVVLPVQARAIPEVEPMSAQLAQALPANASVQAPALPTPDMIEAICAELAAHEGKTWPDGYGEMTQGVRRFAAREGYLAALAVAAGSTSRRQS